MKFALLFCLVSVSALAQVKKEKSEKIDSLNFEFTWYDVFRSAGWDCDCPSTDKVQSMPHELSPYKWSDTSKPIIIDGSTFQQWIKSDQAYKTMYQRADSLQRKKPKIL